MTCFITAKKEFGVNEVKTVVQHFHSTISSVIPNFDVDDVVSEWNMLRHILYKKHGDNLQSMTWKDLYDDEFPMMMSVIDILGAIPPTSVSCETTFSQMKLIKTSRRTKLSSSTLNSLLLVKLESPSISNILRKQYIYGWKVLSELEDLITRDKSSKNNVQITEEVNEVDISNEDVISVDSLDDEPAIQQCLNDDSMNVDDLNDSMLERNAGNFDTDLEELDVILGKDQEDNEDFCDDFISEDDNWSMLISYSREL